MELAENNERSGKENSDNEGGGKGGGGGEGGGWITSRRPGPTFPVSTGAVRRIASRRRVTSPRLTPSTSPGSPVLPLFGREPKSWYSAESAQVFPREPPPKDRGTTDEGITKRTLLFYFTAFYYFTLSLSHVLSLRRNIISAL